MYSNVKRLITSVVLLLAVVVVSPVSAREMKIDGFDADIVVTPDGVINVTESIRVNFVGSWNGLIREIPVEYVTPQGMNYSLFLKVKRITDESGNTLKYESSRERHYRQLKIYVPNARDIREPSLSNIRSPTLCASSKIMTSFTGT